MAFHPSDQFDFGLGYPQGHNSNSFPRRSNPSSRIHRAYIPTFLQQSYMNSTFQPSFPMQGLPYYNPHFTGAYTDDFEEGGEIATRPRLTKEQVDILEGEFTRNPKPNSSHKRDLAIQTGLEPNRVSNWFQNRRAKAKQQRKQAEYQNEQQKENQSKRGGRQHSSDQISQDDEAHNDEDDEEEEEEEIDTDSRVHATSKSSSTEPPAADTSTLAHSASPAEDNMKKRSYDSLQRALKAADDAQAQKETSFQWPHVGLQMPAEIQFHPDTSSPQSSLTENPMQNLLTTSWMHQHADQQEQVQPAVISGDFNFDFGFDTNQHRGRSDSKPLPSPTDSTSRSVVSPGDWVNHAITPTMAAPQGIFHQPLQSPGLPTPTYTSSRRGSTTEGLTSNFEGFAIDNPPFSLESLGEAPFDASDAGNDIASRRRRPRPAALTSASLRSRSYGQLSGQSPTTRQGIPTVSGQSIRHVKSTGHSLHNHYAGIRKSSLPQRSPLNVSTFAEADLQLLLAQRAAGMTPTQHPTANGNQSTHYQQDQSQAGCMMPQVPQFNAGLSGQQMQSPPATPYQQDFFLQSSSMLPPSVHAQYAYMPDYTPPYSAGPMTNSSWSDAPLTSPDITNFPQMTFVPSLTTDAQCEDNIGLWHLSNDINIHSRLNAEPEGKKAQFRIETFPNQDQEHAQISQHFNRPRPNHFVFQHFGQGDFSPAKS